MNRVIEFLKAFFLAEIKARKAKQIPDLNSYNTKLEFMNSFCIEDLHDSFGLIPREQLRNPEYYAKWQDRPENAPRHLFKLSHYKHEKYGDLYLAYVSGPNADSKYDLKYFDCFFISKINNEYKIVRNFFVHKDRDMNTIEWNSHHGDRDIDFDTAGEFISCERYLEPTECEFSMQDYLQDK